MPTRLPNLNKRVAPKRIKVKLDNFAKGLNVLVAATKIRDDELSTATNILLVDEGSPTRRWGTATYSSDSGSSQVDGLFTYYPSTTDSELLKLEAGILKRLSAGSWTNVSGASFTNGTITTATQTNDILYLSNGTDELTKYDGSGLIRFATISSPTAPSLARGASLNSGNYQYSYKMTAVTAAGETAASSGTTVQVDKLREDWNPSSSSIDTNYGVTVTWTPVSGATGYNVYFGQAGDEVFLKYIPGQTANEWVDYGVQIANDFLLAPTGSTATGPKGKYIKEFKTSLIIAGDPDNPSRVWYSAGVDKPDDFTIGSGGGFVDISKNSDDGKIKAVSVFQDSTIIFKERSIWRFSFSTGSFPGVTNIVKGLGAVAHESIQEVENDLLFVGRKPGGGAAMFVLGNEPNYLNVLRTNEISARVRPVMQTISATNFEKIKGLYIDGKYFVFFASGGATSNNEAIIYDRERLGFVRWTNIYASSAIIFYEADGTERVLLVGSDDNRVTVLSSDYTTDKGSPILWTIKTKETDIKEPFNYKRFRTADVRLRNVAGKINFRLITETNSFDYSATVEAGVSDTAYGTFRFGEGSYGIIKDTGENASTDVVRRMQVKRKGVLAVARSLGVEISGTTATSKATLLDAYIEADPRSDIYFGRSEVIDIFNE